jgi:hypothetical protein
MLELYRATIADKTYQKKVQERLLPQVRLVTEFYLCELYIGKLRQFVLYGFGNVQIHDFLADAELSHPCNPFHVPLELGPRTVGTSGLIAQAQLLVDYRERGSQMTCPSRPSSERPLHEMVRVDAFANNGR